MFIVNILVVLFIITAVFVAVAIKNSNKPKPENIHEATPNKCGCGHTQDADGHCDGSHNDVNNKVV